MNDPRELIRWTRERKWAGQVWSLVSELADTLERTLNERDEQQKAWLRGQIKAAEIYAGDIAVVERERDAALAEAQNLRRALGLARSMIWSGERESAQAAAVFDAALSSSPSGQAPSSSEPSGSPSASSRGEMPSTGDPGGALGSETSGQVLVPADAIEKALTFDSLTEANVSRARRWHPGFPDDEAWNGADWSNAMCGEAGEAANFVKKLRRHETGHHGALDGDELSLRTALAAEIADVILYADLLAAKYGINLPAAVVEKFNAVSERQGFPERLAVLPARERAGEPPAGETP